MVILGYILRRVVGSMSALFGISLITYFLIYLLPADPARMYAGPSASVETVARIRHELGLDQPFWVQYARYVGRLLRGDLGFSYRLQMPVGRAIASRLPESLKLIVAAILVELAIGLPVGIVSALRPGSWLDRATMLFALLGISAPPFWLGLLLLYYLAYRASLFPLGGTGSLLHYVLPALTAGLGGGAWYARMVRSSVLEVIRADYVRTARAKGLSPTRVLLRHVMRNALNPIVTMVGIDIPWFLGNIVLVETVFGWPGMGRLAVEAIQTVDVPLIMGTVTVSAVIVVVTSILTDVALAVLDPRIRLA